MADFIATVAIKAKNAWVSVISVSIIVVVVGSLARGAQEKYALTIPNGLAFSEFRGYENWADVAASQTGTEIKAIVANPVMIAAFRSGLPRNGSVFPDGSKVAKIEWSFKKNAMAPYFVTVPDVLKSVDFIEKDTKRFPNSHGWAYAAWDYDAATNTFKPSTLSPSGAECGYACHGIAASQDYIFTAYPKR
jgi:hypothetical protein